MCQRERRERERRIRFEVLYSSNQERCLRDLSWHWTSYNVCSNELFLHTRARLTKTGPNSLMDPRMAKKNAANLAFHLHIFLYLSPSSSRFREAAGLHQHSHDSLAASNRRSCCAFPFSLSLLCEWSLSLSLRSNLFGGSAVCIAPLLVCRGTVSSWRGR